MATRAGAIGNLPWVRGTSFPGVKMAPRGAQHKEAITAELQMQMKNLGIKKFIETYGSSTFQSIAPAVTGGIIGYEASKFIPEIHGGKGPIKTPPPLITPIPSKEEMYPKPLITPIPPPKKDKPEGLPIPTEEKKVPEGFPIPKQKTWKEYILTQTKAKDIKKQTKDLVTEKPEFGALTETEKQTALLEKGDKPDFYSRAIEAIETAKDDTYTKGRWSSILKSSTTKDELDYLGLTELLVGNESISKQELLKLVKDKDIAPGITVRSIPKDQMNPMWEGYSLGGAQEGTVEHIVFQIGKDDAEVGKLYKEPHFDTEYGTGTFAHSRVQVGYSPSLIPNATEDVGDMEHNEWAREISEIFKNIQIVDEIQSQHLQQGRIEGFKSDWKILKGNEITKEFLEKNYPSEYKLRDVKSEEKHLNAFNKILLAKDTKGKWIDQTGLSNNHYIIFNKTGVHMGQNFKGTSFEEAEAEIAKYTVPDFPIKESKKWVELVLNKMIQKAVIDGRDGIAITNGQIQYNRYPQVTEEVRQGLKKAYDTSVYDQLNKIAKKYNIKLEIIDIEEKIDEPTEKGDLKVMENRVNMALDQGYNLQKIPLDILEDLVNNRSVPGHASIYTNEGRGHGVDYILDNLKKSLDNFKHTDEMPEYYVWLKKPLSSYNMTDDTRGHDLDILEEFKKIVWDIPIVSVKDATGEIPASDITNYTDYLINYKLPEGVDLGYPKDAEQLIKMEFPKKLKKDFYGKRIKLTKKVDEPKKIEDQTQRLFA